MRIAFSWNHLQRILSFRHFDLDIPSIHALAFNSQKLNLIAIWCVLGIHFDFPTWSQSAEAQYNAMQYNSEPLEFTMRYDAPISAIIVRQNNMEIMTVATLLGIRKNRRERKKNSNKIKVKLSPVVLRCVVAIACSGGGWWGFSFTDCNRYHSVLDSIHSVDWMIHWVYLHWKNVLYFSTVRFSLARSLYISKNLTFIPHSLKNQNCGVSTSTSTPYWNTWWISFSHYLFWSIVYLHYRFFVGGGGGSGNSSSSSRVVDDDTGSADFSKYGRIIEESILYLAK